MKHDFFKGFTPCSNSDVEQVEQIMNESRRKSEICQQVNVAANIPFRFANATFDMFERDDKEELKSFAIAPENDKIILFSGSTGTGKTTMLCSAIHERGLNGLPCGMYFSCRTLPYVLRSTRYFSSKKSEMDFYDEMAKTPFLCLDEIGASESPQEERFFIRQVIAMRYDNMLPTMMATNLTTLRFKMFLLGMEAQPMKTIDDLKKESEEKGRNDPIMDRFRHLVCVKEMVGVSKR